ARDGGDMMQAAEVHRAGSEFVFAPRANRPRRRASRVDFFQAGDVAAAFKFGGKPGPDDLERVFLGNGALADGEAIGVIVRPAPDRGLLVPAKAAPDAAYAIGDHGLAIARAAQNDAALEFAPRHGFGHGTNVIGIIGRRIFVIGAEIAHGMSFREKE